MTSKIRQNQIIQNLPWTAFVAIMIAAQSPANAKPLETNQPITGSTGIPTVSADWKSTAVAHEPKFTARRKDASSSQEWSRATPRPDPVEKRPASTTAGAPQIQFMSATDTKSSDNSQAVLNVPQQNAPKQEVPPVPQGHERETSAELRPVREQLLNALKAHREALAANGESPRQAGSLTILNPSPPTHPAEDSKGTVKPQSDVQLPESTPASKSQTGLTQILQEDLESDDPLTRERARGYLQLQMQILKLQASRKSIEEQSNAAAHGHTNAAEVGSSPHSIPSTVGHPESEISSSPENAARHDADSRASAAITPNIAIPHGSPVPTAEESNAGVSADPETTIAESPTGTFTESSSSPHASPLENIVVDGPIDRLGLANNLFAVGEYGMAQEMYQQIDASQLDSHLHFWIQFQVASCTRHLGKTAEASNLFRQLAGQPEAGQYSEQARWWVEKLEEMRLIEKSLEDYATLVKTLEVELSHLKESKDNATTH